MKRILLSLLILLTVASVPASIEAKKKVRRTAKTEKYAYLNDVERKVLGKHMLSLQWLSWKYFGYVNITKQPDGTITCRGEQLARNCKDADNDCKTNDDYIKLDGVIDIVDASHLIFVGEIRQKIYHINNGEEVLRKGTFNFVATGNRKYWRMQEMENPVDECVDYIDIYFKR